MLLRQKRDEVPKGTLSCPDRIMEFFYQLRHYEGSHLLLSVCGWKLIQQTLVIKHINEEEHIKLTGHTGKNIIEMFRYLDEINKPVWIRHVLVPGITDNDEYLIQTRDFIRTLGNVQRVEVLPYHGLGAMKYKDLGIDYVLKDTNSPTAERVQNARKILECAEYDGWKN